MFTCSRELHPPNVTKTHPTEFSCGCEEGFLEEAAVPHQGTQAALVRFGRVIPACLCRNRCPVLCHYVSSLPRRRNLPYFSSTDLKLVVQLSSTEALSPDSTQGKIYDRSTYCTPSGEKGHAEQCHSPSAAWCQLFCPAEMALPGLPHFPNTHHAGTALLTAIRLSWLAPVPSRP